MGFPSSFTHLLLPNLFIHFLSFLGFLSNFISIFIRFLRLHNFFQSDIPSDFSLAEPLTDLYPLSAALLRQVLPVVTFSLLPHPPETCAVCLSDFHPDDQIRRLSNCRHIFHRGCVDRWIGSGHRTCPLCRTLFVPSNLKSNGFSFDYRVWEDSEILEALHADSESESSSSSSMNLLVSGS